MRLFLSSQDFGNHADVLRRLTGNNARVAFINNAKDDWEASERANNSTEKQAEFKKLGLKPIEIDLRDYFAKPDELAGRLEDVGLVWCSGGNTFILRRALAQSGLDTLLIDQLQKDTLAYGGSSAGSIIPTPSLHGTELGDDPDNIPIGYEKAIIWPGLRLVPFHIVPHYGSDWFGAEAENMARYMQKNNLPHETLTDGQVVLVDGTATMVLK